MTLLIIVWLHWSAVWKLFSTVFLHARIENKVEKKYYFPISSRLQKKL